MERTPEEIKKGLECCARSCYRCEDDCPYKEQCRNEQGGKAMNEDALAIIQKLENENAAMLETLKRMAHSGGVCIGCVHMDDEPTILEHCEELDFDCEKCPTPCACHSCKEGSNYTWSGVDSNQKTT